MKIMDMPGFTAEASVYKSYGNREKTSSTSFTKVGADVEMQFSLCKVVLDDVEPNGDCVSGWQEWIHTIETCCWVGFPNIHRVCSFHTKIWGYFPC
jgi:hypothetical protein